MHAALWLNKSGSISAPAKMYYTTCTICYVQLHLPKNTALMTLKTRAFVTVGSLRPMLSPAAAHQRKELQEWALCLLHSLGKRVSLHNFLLS